jgi:hypothetical protein
MDRHHYHNNVEGVNELSGWGVPDEEHTVILKGIFTVHCGEVSRSEKVEARNVEVQLVADKSVSTPKPVNNTSPSQPRKATRNCNQMVGATRKATVHPLPTALHCRSHHSVFTCTPTHRGHPRFKGEATIRRLRDSRSSPQDV